MKEETIHQRLKKIRTLEKLTQKEFANIAGCSRDMVAKIEGQKANITFIIAKNLVGNLGVSFKWLASGEGEIYENNNADIDIKLLEAELEIWKEKANSRNEIIELMKFDANRSDAYIKKLEVQLERLENQLRQAFK